MVHQFARWLRGQPVDADATLNLLAGELIVGNGGGFVARRLSSKADGIEDLPRRLPGAVQAVALFCFITWRYHMTQCDVNAAAARVTGESLAVVADFGFQIADPQTSITILNREVLWCSIGTQ